MKYYKSELAPLRYIIERKKLKRELWANYHKSPVIEHVMHEKKIFFAIIMPFFRLTFKPSESELNIISYTRIFN